MKRKVIKVKIGNSDYTRKQMEEEVHIFAIGTTSEHFLETIQAYERRGYIVKFETNIFRWIFGWGRYKVMAYAYEK